MSDRTKQVLLACLFWLVFGIPILFVVGLLPLGIVIYAAGNDHIRDWVYRTGKAMDQLCNAALFGGLPQETVSSHTGRWFAFAPNTIPLKFRFVKWLTDIFEKDHVIKAVEPPFIGMPL